ncbi:hypothetical protein F5X96DRAFT_45718 [Biscogniauxia mediterranea]|nr:hypothetical protein F5X96DRAFT_45718 [Biscogniauxia mediterranea]
MEFFCVRSKNYYYFKKKVKSEYKSRPSSKSKRGFQQGSHNINQIITMASPPNVGGHTYPAWGSAGPPDHSPNFLPAIQQTLPFSSRKPSAAYSNYHIHRYEGQNWNSDEAPDTRSPSFDAAGTAEEPHSRKKPKKPSSKKSGTKSQHRSPEVPAVVSPATPPLAAHEVYVYPWSVSHISFPIVDYSKGRRAHHSSLWPACYMAIAPNCATCQDVEAVLAPDASDLVVIARTSPRGEGRPLRSFRDIIELRSQAFQLEIWDEEEEEASGPSKRATK